MQPLTKKIQIHFMKSLMVLISIAFISFYGMAQEPQAYEDERYVPETNPLVIKKLEKWQNLKFGLLMHWGTYSQWGIVESWSICPEDYGWCQRKKEGTPGTYYEYVNAYENLQTTFNDYNNVLKKLAQDFEFFCVDLPSQWPGDVEASWRFYADGIHPNNAGYDMMTEILYDALRSTAVQSFEKP